jgi:hypothetical protein
VSTPHDILDDALRIVGECEPVDVVASRSAPVAGWGTSRFKSGWGRVNRTAGAAASQRSQYANVRDELRQTKTATPWQAFRPCSSGIEPRRCSYKFCIRLQRKSGTASAIPEPRKSSCGAERAVHGESARPGAKLGRSVFEIEKEAEAALGLPPDLHS